MELYSKPTHITENSNGDVVVSDFDQVYDLTGAVVVTDHTGAIVLPTLDIRQDQYSCPKEYALMSCLGVW